MTDQNVYIIEFYLLYMIMIDILSLAAMVSIAFKSLIGQIGPAYDPLFYDVMVYIFGYYAVRSVLVKCHCVLATKKGSWWGFCEGKVDTRIGKVI